MQMKTKLNHEDTHIQKGQQREKTVYISNKRNRHQNGDRKCACERCDTSFICSFIDGVLPPNVREDIYIAHPRGWIGKLFFIEH